MSHRHKKYEDSIDRKKFEAQKGPKNSFDLKGLIESYQELSLMSSKCLNCTKTTQAQKELGVVSAHCGSRCAIKCLKELILRSSLRLKIALCGCNDTKQLKKIVDSKMAKKGQGPNKALWTWGLTGQKPRRLKKSSLGFKEAKRDLWVSVGCMLKITFLALKGLLLRLIWASSA